MQDRLLQSWDGLPLDMGQNLLQSGHQGTGALPDFLVEEVVGRVDLVQHWVETLSSVGREGSGKSTDSLKLNQEGIDQSLSLGSGVLTLGLVGVRLDVVDRLVQIVLELLDSIGGSLNDGVLVLELLQLGRSGVDLGLNTGFPRLLQRCGVCSKDVEWQASNFLRGRLERVRPLGLGEVQSFHELVVDVVQLAVEGVGDGLSKLDRVVDQVLADVVGTGNEGVGLNGAHCKVERDMDKRHVDNLVERARVDSQAVRLVAVGGWSLLGCCHCQRVLSKWVICTESSSREIEDMKEL